MEKAKPGERFKVEVLSHYARVVDEEGNDVVLCGDVRDGRHDDAELVAAALNALDFIVRINGSTGGPKALVAELKHVAATALGKLEAAVSKAAGVMEGR